MGIVQTRRDMHRRAQKAEGRLERMRWWIDAGLAHAENKAKKDGVWPHTVPRFYLEEIKRELDRL